MQKSAVAERTVDLLLVTLTKFCWIPYNMDDSRFMTREGRAIAIALVLAKGNRNCDVTLSGLRHVDGCYFLSLSRIICDLCSLSITKMSVLQNSDSSSSLLFLCCRCFVLFFIRLFVF